MQQKVMALAWSTDLLLWAAADQNPDLLLGGDGSW